ncbi:MAG TPA: flagellar basal body protein [Caulobacteraceae bacterium]|jgi:hypothetical protein
MAISAESPTDRVEQLIALTERLTDLLAAETRAYEAHRPHEAAAAAQETVRMANVYRHESLRVKKDTSLLAEAPEALRTRLLEATRTFEATLARHAAAVGAALTVTEGIVRAVAEEVAASRKSAAGYGRAGKAAPAASAPLALNKRA